MTDAAVTNLARPEDAVTDAAVTDALNDWRRLRRRRWKKHRLRGRWVRRRQHRTEMKRGWGLNGVGFDWFERGGV